MDEVILQVEDVKKKIGKKAIIKGIGFEIRAGEVFGFLGPNGAGKSTTLRMIVGLSRPTSGRIAICGHSITDEYLLAMRDVGCMIEKPDLYEYLSGYRNLEMLAEMSAGVGRDEIWAAVETVGMENRIYDKVSAYSLGMKQRLGLAQALMHRPKLLVLDEPMNGLDPKGIHMFKELAKRLARDRQVAVLVSSHLISEVQQFCDRVAIINDGLIVKDAPTDQLLPCGEVVWEVDEVEKARAFLLSRFDIHGVVEGDRLKAAIDAAELAMLNAALVEAGFALKTVRSAQPSLESLFLGLTEHQKIT